MKIFLLILCMLSFPAHGQPKPKPQDSVDMKTQIEGFYTWYINLIRSNKVNSEFNPRFARKKDGMTMLDFRNYKGGLSRFKFSEKFINRKISDYKVCVDNLEKIPFETFLKYTDLDDFEQIECDFSNRYEWIGGQEPKGKAELLNLRLMNANDVVGQIRFITEGKVDGTANVRFKKNDQHWEIENIELESGHR